MKKKFLVSMGVAILTLSLTLVGCSSSQPSSQPSGGNGGAAKEELKPVTLKLGHNSATDSITDISLKDWAKAVSDKTGGKLTIEIYPQNQLGTNKEMSDMTALGSLDMNVQGLSTYIEYGVPQGYLAKVPFLFKSMDVAVKFWQGPDGQEFMKQTEQKGVKILSAGINRMPREMASKSKPIKTPDDLKGLKIRAGDTATNSTLKILGGVPTQIALNEMYTAVSQGMVDVIELPLDYFYNYSMYEVLKYLSITDHTFDVQALTINKKKFESLPAEFQKAIEDTIPAMEKANNEAMEKDFEDYLQKLKDKGMEVITVDRAQFEAMIPQVVPELEKTWPETKGYYQKILDMK